ncbi:MAG: hypothetical protein LUC45_03615, partial [Paraprevotella sp.]|nr:hypothetical protein [Paraprevotella sp.]
HVERGCVRDMVMAENPGLRGILELYREDSLKRRAALFLIDNMAYNQGADSGELDAMYKAYEIFSTGKYTYQQSLDSAEQIYGKPKDVKDIVWKADIDMDPGFLVSNIEWAFKVWREQPWGKNVSFEQFCEYVSPYRIGNEELIPWREKLYYQFMPIIEKYKNDPQIENPTFAAHVILDSLLRAPFYFTGEMGTCVRIGPRIVDWRGGSCLDLCDMLVYIYRALGIPCGIEELPLRGNNNAPHYWNFLVDPQGQTWYFSMFYWWHRLFKAEVYADVYGKVFRQRFSLNHDMMDSLQLPLNEVHPMFRYPFFEDVTALYATNKAFDLTVGKSHFSRILEKGQVVYICMSDRLSWKPVGWAKYDGSEVTFKSCHGGTIYCLAIYEAGKERLNPVTSPFSVDQENGKLCFYDAQAETENVVLLSKFGMLGEFFLGRMVNGVFEGSNTPSFTQKDTLFKVNEVPNRLCTVVTINPAKAYRYIRYYGPTGGYANISEATFYSSPHDTVSLSGKVIGPEEGACGDHSYFNVFDGHTDTSYDYPLADGGWAGLDLGEKKYVRKICYSPRNRDNFVRKGDLYELLFCDRGVWFPFARQTAQSDSLVFNGVPKHALLLLRDLSRGEAERLFEYQGGKQRFW